MADGFPRDDADDRPREHGKQIRLDGRWLVAYPQAAHVLRLLLSQSKAVAGTAAGSVSLVTSGDRYVKVAEYNIPCTLGGTFPLDQGATGQAFARRRPVVIADYAAVVHGHLPANHPARHRAVAAVPVWWRGEVVGVNVAFAAAENRSFAPRQLDALEELTQAVASPLVRATWTELPLAALLRTRADAAIRRPDSVITEVGAARPVPPAIAEAAADLVTIVGEASARRPDARLHVAVVYRPDGLRLLVQDEAGASAPAGTGVPPDPLGLGTRSWHELRTRAGAAVAVEAVPGWGTLVRAELPYAAAAEGPGPSHLGTGTPLTGRESEVLTLLARGLSDRDIAAALVISPKTVEKHVGAVLRKTGTSSRTAAVVTALDRGWVERP